MKDNVLILGGTGFIGQNIVEDLARDNFNIILLVRDFKQNANKYITFENVTVLEGNISQLQLIESILVEYKIELVIHLVSNLIPSSSLADFNIELNEVVFPTFNLIEILSKLNIKLVYFSSGGTIYGKANDFVDENNSLNPINYYGCSKLMIENHIRFLNQTKELSYLILRPSNVFGRYQRIEAKQGFVAVALGKFISNSSMEIWGDGEVVRDFIDVQDVAKALRMLIINNTMNVTLNLGSGEGNSLNEIIKILENVLNRNIKVIYKDKRNIDLDRMILNVNKIKKCIDFKPKSLNQGIADFVKFTREEVNEK